MIIESHSTIGATGVAWAWDPDTRQRIIPPKTGFTTIGKNTYIGTDVTVARGSINEITSIAKGCIIAHGVKIGSGSRIGAECHLANNVTIAGNVSLGMQCFLGVGVVIRPQTRLADRTTVGAGAVVVNSFEEPDRLLKGVPARSAETMLNMTGIPRGLDK